jgi:hypothetical protein
MLVCCVRVDVWTRWYVIVCVYADCNESFNQTLIKISYDWIFAEQNDGIMMGT